MGDLSELEYTQLERPLSQASGGVELVWREMDVSAALGQPAPRSSHTCDLMPTPGADRLLVLGGDTGKPPEDAQRAFVLDVHSRSWSPLRFEGEPPRGTIGHATAVQDSRLYVLGGFDPKGGTKSLDQAYHNQLIALECAVVPPRWEPLKLDSSSREKQPHLPAPRRDHTLSMVRGATMSRESSMMKVGGGGGGGGGGGARPSAGPLLVFGGWDLLSCRNDLHRWVSTKNVTAWMAQPPPAGAPPPPCARRGHSATVDGGALIVYGGCYGLCGYLDDLHALDVKSMRWERPTTTGASPGARAWHTATQLSGGTICFFGGARRGAPTSGGDGGGGGGSGGSGGGGGGAHGASVMVCLNDLFLLDTQQMIWDEIAPAGVPPSPRCGHTATVVSGLVYIVGGRGTDGKPCTDFVYTLEAEGLIAADHHALGGCGSSPMSAAGSTPRTAGGATPGRGAAAACKTVFEDSERLEDVTF